MKPTLRVLTVLLSLALLLPAAPILAGEDTMEREVDYWVRVLEPTEAYANGSDELWIISDDVIWMAHVGEWYEVLAIILNDDGEDWLLVIREDDPDELAVWLVVTDRIELLIDPAADRVCGGLTYFRCIGSPL